MATINRKAGVLIAAAAMAIAATGMSTPSFAQREEHGQRGGDRGGGNRGANRSSGGERPRGALPTPRENARVDMGPQLRQMREEQRQAQQRPVQQQQARPAPQQSGGQRPMWQGGSRPDGGQGRPGWSGGDNRPGGDRPGNVGQPGRPGSDRNPAWRADNDRRDNDRRDDDRRNNSGWRGNDGWRGNNGWRGNDNDRDRGRDNNAWRNNGRGDGGRDRYQTWNRNDWRRDNRYDWQRYRSSNRNTYRIGRYYAPYNGYSYRRLSIGFSLGSMFYGSRYWINDPYDYRLPPVYGPYRWVRYYDDVLLVDTYSGEVVDVIYDFFW